MFSPSSTDLPTSWEFSVKFLENRLIWEEYPLFCWNSWPWCIEFLSVKARGWGVILALATGCYFLCAYFNFRSYLHVISPDFGAFTAAACPFSLALSEMGSVSICLQAGSVCSLWDAECALWLSGPWVSRSPHPHESVLQYWTIPLFLKMYHTKRAFYFCNFWPSWIWEYLGEDIVGANYFLLSICIPSANAYYHSLSKHSESYLAKCPFSF